MAKSEPFDLGYQHGQEDTERGTSPICYRPPDEYSLEQFEEYIQGYAEGKLG